MWDTWVQSMSWEDSPGEVTDYICENVFNLRDYQLKIIAYLSIYIYLAKLCMQILLYISLMTSKTKKKAIKIIHMQKRKKKRKKKKQANPNETLMKKSQGKIIKTRRKEEKITTKTTSIQITK